MLASTKPNESIHGEYRGNETTIGEKNECPAGEGTSVTGDIGDIKHAFTRVWKHAFTRVWKHAFTRVWVKHAGLDSSTNQKWRRPVIGPEGPMGTTYTFIDSRL